ncbi:MAG: hypothetical protein GKS00_14255 [Alphaproteobacteria bacterium]|nr:hypothetical protein [Alphaproteobacteria bacterium]
MAKIALIVEFNVKAEHRVAFITLLREHAEGTVQEEEGCVQFDVLLPNENGRVFLYEVYRDEVALKAHMASERLANTRSSYDGWIDDRTIHVCTVG